MNKLTHAEIEDYADDDFSSCPVYQKTKALSYEFDLNKDVDSQDKYVDLFRTLRSMTENDDITIYIATSGGYLTTAIQLVAEIRNCKGHVHGVLASDCYSAGSIVFLSCHSQEVYEHASLMAHDAFGGAVGKISERVRQTNHDAERLRNLYHDVYKHFFTPEEIDRILSGVDDGWVLYDEICDRLERRQELEQKAAEENTQYITYDDLMKMTKKDILSTLGVQSPDEM